jgi:hypothetical protein
MSGALSQIGDLDLLQLESIQLPLGSNEIDDDVDIAAPPLTQSEKDAELELEIPVDAEDRQEVFRPKISEYSDRVLLSLILYSGLVKNMELIPDSDKRRHLASIFRGWAILLVASLRFAPRLAKERRVRINGAMYEVQAPQGMSDATLLRQMMLRLPFVHARLISGALGTDKLERQLSEPTLDQEGEPKIIDYFRTGVIADLRLASMPGAVEALVAKLRNNHYLLRSLIVHITELRRLDRVTLEHFKRLEAPLAAAIASLKGGSHVARENEKQRQIRRLAKDRLLLTIKRDQEKRRARASDDPMPRKIEDQ